MKNKRVVVIGSGFAGLSVDSHLAKDGYDVSVFEKNDTPGGRARSFSANGFTFDMGPSWYWMPDVFEAYFTHFGKQVSDYYELARLDPSYSVFFDADHRMHIPATKKNLLCFVDLREAQFQFIIRNGEGICYFGRRKRPPNRHLRKA